MDMFSLSLMWEKNVMRCTLVVTGKKTLGNWKIHFVNK